MLVSRTAAAWHLSCQKLFDEYSPIYFWTFTFKETLPDWWYPYRWHSFTRELVWGIYGGTLAGLRVIECHAEHGLHYHALLNRRIWVGLVRAIGRRYGIGRIHVRKRAADIGAADYLAKYLDKDRFPTATRISRWHSVGIFQSVRVGNLTVQSHLNNAIAEAQEAKGEQRLTYAEYHRLKLEHYDLIQNRNAAPRYAPLPVAEPTLTPDELDTIWPAEPPTSTPKTYVLDPTLTYQA